MEISSLLIKLSKGSTSAFNTEGFCAMGEPKRKCWVFPACCLIAAGIALMGCRSEEQNRLTRIEQGTYLGKPDQKLTDEQVNALQHRAREQQG